ncbi:hypothetical protein J7J90_02180 [Candidatus Micrarchaeota archaeon]|nr:hypothetical protein [Candidatus Micrarchaeota archaeon]
MARKGVFFTVVMVVFLFALSLALVKWSQGSKMHEYRMSKHVYLDSVITASQILSDERIEKFSQIAARHAVFELANYTSSPYANATSESHRLKTENDVPTALAGLMFNGSAHGSLFNAGGDFNYTNESMAYTFKSFRDNAQNVCDAVGWECNISEPYNVHIYQDSPWSVRFNFTINKTIRDPTGKYSINAQPVNVSVNVSIIGMPDPLTTQLSRAGAPAGGGLIDPSYYYRLIYKSPKYTRLDDIPADLEGVSVSNYLQSKGFFYGIPTRDEDVDPSKAWKYIFVGDWGHVANAWAQSGDAYGAYIVEMVERSDPDDCVGPFTATTSFLENAGNCRVDCSQPYNTCRDYEVDCLFDCFDYYYNISAGSCDTSLNENVPDGCSGVSPTYCDPWCSNILSSEKYTFSNHTSKPYIKIKGEYSDDINIYSPSSVLYNENEFYPYQSFDSSSHFGILINAQNDTNVTYNLGSASSDEVRDVWFDLLVVPNVYNIEPLRDMAVCGFFVESGRAPSFFQRMVVNGDEKSDGSLGIESFAVGKWAIDDDSTPDVKWSNVDFIYHKCWRGGSCPTAYKVKGMPGCKNKEMCSSNEANEDGVGHFVLDEDSAKNFYGVWNYFVCGQDVAAPCE